MISFHKRAFNPLEKYGYAKDWNCADIDDLERIAKCMTNYVWSPIVYKAGRRNQESFYSCNLFALDFEDESYTIDKACKQFKDFAHVIGTTRNHQIDKDGVTMDRFRVVIKTGEMIKDLETYRYNMELIVNAFPCDKKCKDGARLFYPCREIVQINSDGLCAVVEKPKKKVTVNYQAYYDAGILTPFLRKLVNRNGVSPGSRNNTAYQTARELYKLGRSKDQAFEFILKHIYNDFADNVLLLEIRRTILSAYK